MASVSSFQTTQEQCRSALKRFLDSHKDFEVITSVARAGLDPSPPSEAHTQGLLYVLDSSFNPPTKAHEHIAGSAIVENRSQPVWGKPSRVLLLLATQNADKPSQPASFEDRLIMMQLCARDLQKSMSSLVDEINCPVVDIGVTKKPYFVDKATAIETAGVYPSELQQVHCTGYDTLIRIFNTKYYPPEHVLAPLEPFLSKHKLRVTVRPDDEWGSQEQQEAYVEDLARGGRESEGGKREWAKQIEIVEGSIVEKRPISSTKAREAIQGNSQDLDWLVQPSVREFVLSQKPYSG